MAIGSQQNDPPGILAPLAGVVRNLSPG